MLSVVIPTYNRLKTLQYVLEGFQKQTFPLNRFEVIVVDSMSNDGTEVFMQNFKPHFHLRYIRQENRGRPGARNRGIQEAKGEVVLFNDADIIPQEDWLEKHEKFHEIFPNSAAVGWEARINTFEELAEAKANPDTRFRIHPPRVKNLSWLYFLTGNASVPRKLLLDVGGFDETFQGYGFEDLELGYRLWKRGVKIYYWPEAVNYHLDPRPLELQYEVQRMAGRNAVYFYKKHGDWRIRWLLGMSPLAFAWHAILLHVPGILSFLERKAKQEGGAFSRSIILQHHYLLGVKEAWKK